MQTAIEFYYGEPVPLSVIASVREWVDGLPDKPFMTDEHALWSCHGICRAVIERFQFENWHVVDGYFMRVGQEHSWLRRNDGKFILDVYPVAAFGGPLLVDALSHGSPWQKAYIGPSPDYLPGRTKKFDDEAALALSCGPS